MAQFIPFAPGVEVNGQTVLSVVEALDAGKETRRAILAKHGLGNVDPHGWFAQQQWLNAFREIAEEIGDYTLFSIGKAIPEHAIFPPEIDSLEKALAAIDVAYHMNHRNGEIGNYKLLSFDAAAKVAVMECKNPYPSEFDRGIITTMLRRFKPALSTRYDVVRDTSKPTRLEGADSCTYLITW